MKKPVMRLYLDTSVFGGVHDVEFETDSKRLIDAIHAKKFLVMMSDVVLDDLVGAPANVKKSSRTCRLVRFFELKSPKRSKDFATNIWSEKF